MNEDTLAELLASLPDNLRHRADALARLAEGTLPAHERAALEAAAASDEDLALALTLFAPFDAAEVGAVEARVQAALPAPAAAGRPALQVISGAKARETSGRRVVAAFGGLLAAAAVLIAIMTIPPKAAFKVHGGPDLVTAEPGSAARFELEWLRSGDAPDAAVILAVAGQQVRRTQVALRAEGGRLVAEAPARELTGGLAGPVELLFLAPTKEDHALEPGEVRNMIAAFGDRAAARLLVQPPAYALLVRAEGTLRGGHSEAARGTVTASTAVYAGGRVTFELAPQVAVAGELAAQAFVARPGKAPEALPARFETLNAAFRTHLDTDVVLAGGDEATVYLVVGPAAQPVTAPQAVDALPAEYQRVVRVLYRAPQPR